MKVLITGASGFVGSNLAAALAKQGDEVYCLVRRTSNLRWLQSLPVKYHYGELQDKPSLAEAVQDKDIIYHVAGVIKARDRAGYEQGNYLATKNLIESVYRHNRSLKRFVQVSSLAAAGPCLNGICHREEAAACPITDYGITKLKSENEVKKYAAVLPVTIIRPPVIYGPQDDGLYVYFKVVSLGIKPIFTGNKSVSIIYIDDLVRGMIQAATNPRAAGATYYLTNDRPAAFNYLSNLITRVLGKKVITFYVADKLLKIGGALSELLAEMREEIAIYSRQKAREMNQSLWGCLNDRARAELGFRPEVPLEEGIRRTARWYKQMGWI